VKQNLSQSGRLAASVEPIVSFDISGSGGLSAVRQQLHDECSKHTQHAASPPQKTLEASVKQKGSSVPALTV
jgi:hypothetical protein